MDETLNSEGQQGARWETLQLKGEPSSIGRGTPRAGEGRVGTEVMRNGIETLLLGALPLQARRMV